MLDIKAISSKLLEKNSQDEHPRSEKVVEIIKIIRASFFPGYFGDTRTYDVPTEFAGQWHETMLADLHRDLSILTNEQVAEKLINAFPEMQQVVYKDAQAGFDGDPAARSVDEVILTYPGFFAVFIHRIAHFLFKENVPLLPRMMSEYAHSITGIDIHPGAQIGEYFFIDHGTGVVIGETSVIGNHVKLYQGVTIGALSVKKCHDGKCAKRHPTIEDNVTVYSGASILGGDTVIGEGAVIGGNAFIVKSVPAGTVVRMVNPELQYNDGNGVKSREFS